MITTSPWHVEVLGPPRLPNVNGEALPLDRKSSALLAYLALQGPTSRAKLAALLWPASKEGTARNNLAQTLRKLRLARQPDLIVGREALRLADDVRVDARDARDLYRAERFEAFVTSYRDVLGPFDFDDCPEFEDWLLAERERWQEWRRAALRTLALHAEDAGDLGEALTWARQLLAVNAASEEAYALVMRLQFALGDRPRALETLRACEEMLAQEFGVQPTDQTLALARFIREGQEGPSVRPSGSRHIPLSVLRPPLFVGREREWALMEEAWAHGQGVCLVGEAGVGKSRLVQEFARAHGGDFYFECRPGDDKVLYGTTIRMLRKLLERYPQLSFEPWVTQQLGRILPEFGPPPAPLTGQADKVRFYQALTEVLRGAIQAGMTVLAYDDTHHFDDASAEAQLFMWGALGWGDPDAAFRIVFNSRPQEYTSLAAHALMELVRTGRVLVIELGPLAPDAVQRLVESIDVPHLPAITPALQRYTGGNPQFLLETVKHLIETGGVEEGFPKRLPPPGPVRDVVTRRLARLSPTALHTAQAAAVLRSDFTLEMVAQTLRTPLLDVLPAWQELERAQMIAEGRFSHDLVYEAVEANLPPDVSRALHRSAARVLEEHGFPAARAARHWLEGGEPRRAAPKFREAAEEARAALRFVEAAAFLEQASVLLEAHGDRDEAFDARHLMTRDFLKEFDLGERYEASVARLFDLARTSAQRARAWHCQGLLHSRRDERGLALEAAQRGFSYAEESGSLAVYAELSQFLGIVALQADELPKAAAAFRRAAATYEQLGGEGGPGHLSALQNLGVVLGKLGRYAEAAEHLRALDEQSERAGRPILRMTALTNLALAVSRLGRKREAHGHAERALALLEGAQGREMNRVLLLLSLGVIERDLGQYARALGTLERARAASEAYNRFAWALVTTQIATVYTSLGDAERARALAREALAAAKEGVERTEALRALVGALAELGEAFSQELGELQASRAHLGVEDALRVDVTRSGLGVADAAEREALLEKLRASEARESLVVAEMLHARHLAREGRRGEAVACALEAARLLDTYDPLEVPRDRLLAWHAEILATGGHPDAEKAARRARDAACATAATRVPTPYRDAYLAFVLGRSEA